jgi:hypothetical protein
MGANAYAARGVKTSSLQPRPPTMRPCRRPAVSAWGIGRPSPGARCERRNSFTGAQAPRSSQRRLWPDSRRSSADVAHRECHSIRSKNFAAWASHPRAPQRLRGAGILCNVRADLRPTHKDRPSRAFLSGPAPKVPALKDKPGSLPC